MKVFACVLLAVAAQAAPAPEADPALLYGAYAGLPYAGVYGAGVYGAGVYGAGVYGAGVYGYPYAAAVAPALTYAVKPLELKTDVTATNLPVPVAIGGYKAEAGNNGDLVGAVHEVPGLLPAPALFKQENSNGGALTVGTSAVISHSFVKREAEAEADPALLYGGLPYAGVYGAGVYGASVYGAGVYGAGVYGAGVYGYPYAVKPLELKTDVTATNLPVPVAIGGYKAEAGNNGDLVGAVHEVPGLLPAPALFKQENSNGGALTVGTSAVISHSFVKREAEAEADPALLYGGLPYAGVYGAGVYGAGVYGAGVYGYPYAAAVAPALTYAVKPLELKTDVTATNLPVPVAIGGYKAEAGNNGDLVGAVHEVPGLLPAPALFKQENSNGGALTVGTSAVISHSFVKREAEAEADPALLYGTYGYAGHGYAGHGYAGYGYSGLGYAGYLGYPHTYGAYAGYPYYG